MNGPVIIDANLLVLLVVGSASTAYISQHKRLSGYSVDDFELLTALIIGFSDIVTVPHVLAEVSNLVRQMRQPAFARVQATFSRFVAAVSELPIPSVLGCAHPMFAALGLTDAVLMHVCAGNARFVPTLLTVDTDLANAVASLGSPVINYKAEFQAP